MTGITPPPVELEHSARKRLAGRSAAARRTTPDAGQHLQLAMTLLELTAEGLGDLERVEIGRRLQALAAKELGW